MILDQTSGAIQQLSTTAGLNVWTWTGRGIEGPFCVKDFTIFVPGDDRSKVFLPGDSRETVFVPGDDRRTVQCDH